MTNEELYDMSIKPQLDLMNESINDLKDTFSDFVVANADEHKEIAASIDTIQNGNGVIGHKQLAAEWDEHKTQSKSKKAFIFQIILVIFNCGLAGTLAFIIKNSG